MQSWLDLKLPNDVKHLIFIATCLLQIYRSDFNSVAPEVIKFQSYAFVVCQCTSEEHKLGVLF